MTEIFAKRTLEQIRDGISRFIMGGKASESKDEVGEVFYEYLRGIAGEGLRAYEAMRSFSRELDINQAVELLEDWEKEVGIPDECFPGNGTLEERRAHVIVKFAQMNVQTADDFIMLGETLGFPGIIVKALQDTVIPAYDVPFIPTESPSSRYGVFVQGADVLVDVPPYDVPFIPNEQNSSFLECVFNLVKAANTEIVFSNI